MKSSKKMGMGGMHMMPDGSMMQNSMMKKGGSVSKKPKMAMGKSKKDVPADKKGLAKLPTAVRNKMGYKEYGGSTEMKCGGMMKNGGMVKKTSKKK